MPEGGTVAAEVERHFDLDDLVVCKTDLDGNITYANDVFLRITEYAEAEVLGQPHSIVRHPDMPRCIFKLMWETLEAGRGTYVFIKNLTRNGDHFWVLAHVTPSRSPSGEVVAYHASCRAPNRLKLEDGVVPWYHRLIGEERAHADHDAGLAASTAAMQAAFAARGVSYEGFLAAL